MNSSSACVSSKSPLRVAPAKNWMRNLRNRIKKLGGRYDEARRAYCESLTEFLTANGTPVTAEEIDAELPSGVTCWDELILAWDSEQGTATS